MSVSAKSKWTREARSRLYFERIGDKIPIHLKTEDTPVGPSATWTKLSSARVGISVISNPFNPAPHRLHACRLYRSTTPDLDTNSSVTSTPISISTKMAQRVTLRKRQPYNTTSNRRRVVKTPGGKLVVHHLKKKAVSYD